MAHKKMGSLVSAAGRKIAARPSTKADLARANRRTRKTKKLTTAPGGMVRGATPGGPRKKRPVGIALARKKKGKGMSDRARIAALRASGDKEGAYGAIRKLRSKR